MLLGGGTQSDPGVDKGGEALASLLPELQGPCLWVTGRAAPEPMRLLHAILSHLLTHSAPHQVVEEDIPKQKEQTHFTVRLTEAKPVDKVKLIKEIKNYVQGINLVQVSSGLPSQAKLGQRNPGLLSDLTLWQAKKLVESLPQEIKANVAKAEAEKIKAALEAVGGTVVLE